LKNNWELNDLTMKGFYILFVVSSVIQFRNSPYHSYLDVMGRNLRYIKGSLKRGLSYAHRGHFVVVVAYTT